MRVFPVSPASRAVHAELRHSDCHLETKRSLQDEAGGSGYGSAYSISTMPLKVTCVLPYYLEEMWLCCGLVDCLKRIVRHTTVNKVSHRQLDGIAGKRMHSRTADTVL